MDLRARLTDSKTTIGELAKALDELGPAERLAWTRSLDKSDQRALYALAAQGPACTLEDLVPQAVQARVPVIHAGRNTLPLPGGLRVFEKRFCRPEDGPPRLFGYNEGRTRKLIGPGYFVAHATAGTPAWEKRSAVVVDYFMVPDGPVADGWPKVVKNSHGLQLFVFQGTRDFMRRVSRHVTIGAAYKGERSLGQFFVLCRKD